MATSSRRQNLHVLRYSRLLLYLPLLLAGVLILLPFAYMLSTSLKMPNEVFSVPFSWVPRHAVWSNFVAGWRQENFTRYFFNSLAIACAVTVLNLITCSAAGYSFAKFHYPGRDILFGFVLATLMIPYASIIVPLFLVVKSLGWIDTYQGLIVPAGTSAFGVFLMRQHMFAVPDELLAAARIDGAGELQVFVRIVLPLVKTSLSALAIFIFMWNWDSFLWPLLVVQSDSMRTMPIALAAFEGSYTTNDAQLMAVATLAMLPVVIVFLVLQRNFMEALTLSGIKE